MPSPTTDHLVAAHLEDGERRAVERLRSGLADELGDDLLALWLYGSRARDEAHADSDIDLMVIVDGARDRYRRIAGDLGEAAALAEGVSPFSVSVHTQDLEWLEGRRQVDSFFIQEVDRDKVVLTGSALE